MVEPAREGVADERARKKHNREWFACRDRGIETWADSLQERAFRWAKPMARQGRTGASE